MYLEETISTVLLMLGGSVANEMYFYYMYI